MLRRPVRRSNSATRLSDSDQPMTNSCLVIGGGLAGLVCAIRLESQGRLQHLIDTPVSGLGGGLGGFAEFSGAKFSLPPAGLGLAPLAGGVERLNGDIEKVVTLLGLEKYPLIESRDYLANEDPSNMKLRGYRSHVLSKLQITDLIHELSLKVPSSKVVLSKVRMIEPDQDGTWHAYVDNGQVGSEEVGRPTFFQHIPTAD